MGIVKASYFLVHCETGQRYPIKTSAIIGRKSADIVFPGDLKLSNQHCEVVPARRGLSVRDLHSVNGTQINGTTISADRPFLLRPDSELSVGGQLFTLIEVNHARKMRKHRRKQQSSGDSYGLVFMIVVAAVVFFSWRGRSIQHASTLTSTQKQLAEIFENYQELELSLDRQSTSPHDIGLRIQSEVLGRLSAVSRRWAEFQPADGERANFTAQLHFASALSGHARTELLYISSGDLKYVDELDSWNAQIEQAVGDMHQLPSNATNPFPSLIQSPLQLVEREMRQAMREYQKLGKAVQERDVTDAQMAQAIRTDLMPKMMSVYSKMGAIVPQTDFERRKVMLEQKLMTAFVGQVKTVAIYSTNKDPRYAKELEHWTTQLQRVNAELKAQINPARVPAGRQ